MFEFVGYSNEVIALMGNDGPIARRIVARAQEISRAWWAIWDAMIADEASDRAFGELLAQIASIPALEFDRS